MILRTTIQSGDVRTTTTADVDPGCGSYSQHRLTFTGGQTEVLGAQGEVVQAEPVLAVRGSAGPETFAGTPLKVHLNSVDILAVANGIVANVEAKELVRVR